MTKGPATILMQMRIAKRQAERRLRPVNGAALPRMRVQMWADAEYEAARWEKVSSTRLL